MKSGDIILKINGIDLSGMGSEQAAKILTETGNQVELEIARGELPQFPQYDQSYQVKFKLFLIFCYRFQII